MFLVNNKKGVALLLLFKLFFISSLVAQTRFNNRVDYYNRPNDATCVLIDNDTILVGVSTWDSLLTNVYKISVLKLDINGNILSKKSFLRDSLSLVIGNNILKSNNEYFIPGTSGDFHGHVFGSIYEFNSNLDTIRTIIKSDTSHFTYYTNLIKKGNDLYIFGESDSTCGASGYKFFLKKADSLGNIIWQKQYGSTCTYRNSRNMDTTHTNGFVMCGIEQTSPFGWGTSYIIKTDSLGNLLWQKYYGNVNSYWPSIVTTKTAGYLVAANQIDSSYMTSFYWMTLKLYRLNENGDTVWTKKIGQKANDFGPSIVKQLPNYDFIISGVNRVPHYDIGGNLVSDQLQGFLCLIDSSGNVKWFNNYKANSLNDTTTENYLYDVSQTSDGSFVAVGWVSPSDGTTQDVWVIKVDSTGCLIGGCNLTTGIDNQKIDNKDFNIYPNPANDFIDVEGIIDFKNCYLSVYDNIGKLILKEKVVQNKIRINLSDFSNGLYFIQVQSEEEAISKKFIKE